MTIETSPMPLALQGPMDFGAAMQRVLKGERITRLAWDSNEFYGFLSNSLLSLHTPNGKSHQWVVSEGDLVGTDYIVI